MQRAKEVKQASTQAAAPQGSPAASPGQAPSSEAAALYKKQDLSLKEGQTIKCGTVHAPHNRLSLPHEPQERLLCICTATLHVHSRGIGSAPLSQSEADGEACVLKHQTMPVLAMVPTLDVQSRRMQHLP